MRITNIDISNFRGIKKLEARDLGDTIIVAGQNGSGKSCIFDAVRLVKSTYGGYQQNEWQQFFGEFQIQLQGRSRNLDGLFNDKRKPVRIEVGFQLREREREYIKANLAELTEQTIWCTLIPEAFQWGDYTRSLYTAQFRERQSEVDERLKAVMPIVESELTHASLGATIEISPEGSINLSEANLLSIVFSNYRPRQIGVIDFHGAQRHYGREVVQGINLNLDQQEQQYSAHSLYNYNNKYNNVKSEMAGNYIKELLAEKASASFRADHSLDRTLKELFEAFFPNKNFLGPQPTIDGSMRFPVRTADGTEHDLDELSSGEKEILYGYLRIRSSAPQDSIILLDEPELHLNPRLIRGLPDFYKRHLGEALQNQIWLVTHSDALIREAVGKPGFSVFHMVPASASIASDGQLKQLGGETSDLDFAVADLVGDLAAYRPGGKGLLFEGGGDSEFDKKFVLKLFPEELEGVNILSATNKVRVKLLHEVLERAYEQGDIPTKFFAIVDADFDDEGSDFPQKVRRFSWDVYHIENYLLGASHIASVLNGIVGEARYTAALVDTKLEAAAREIVPSVIYEKLRNYGNSSIIRGINASFDPKSPSPSEALRKSLEKSQQRVNELLNGPASLEAIKAFEQQTRQQVETAFADGSWRKLLPGRDIIKRFVANENLSVSYEIVRNLVVARMAEVGDKPVGMSSIIQKIADD